MKRDDLFARYEPPPGGLGRLRTRMAEPARSFRVPVAALATAVVVVAMALWAGSDIEPAFTMADLAEPSEPVTLSAASASTAAVARVETSNPDVIFYWVSSLGSPPSGDAAPEP